VVETELRYEHHEAAVRFMEAISPTARARLYSLLRNGQHSQWLEEVGRLSQEIERIQVVKPYEGR